MSELQSLAGNAAVAGLIQSAGSGPVVQRQDAGEFISGAKATDDTFICTSEHEPEVCWTCVSADRRETIRARRIVPFLPDPEFVPPGTVMTFVRPGEAAPGPREGVETEVTPAGGGAGGGGEQPAPGGLEPAGLEPGGGAAAGGEPAIAEPGSRVIRRGSTGAAVVALQEALNREGADPPLVADGIFGVRTEVAVRAFQASHGLAADGIVGPLTLRELGFAPPGSPAGSTAPR
jgi:hypothetical protein